jgi:hypothetical protein
MQVVVARELPQVLAYIRDIACLKVIFQGALELCLELFIGESLIPEVLHVVLKRLQ